MIIEHFLIFLYPSFIFGNLIDESRVTCVVSDETPSDTILLDDQTDQPCQIVQSFGIKPPSLRIVQAGNPFAKLFQIDNQSFVLKTTRRIDREILCDSKSLDTYQSSCCLKRSKICILKFIAVENSVEKIVNFNLKLIDINDNRPYFPKDLEEISVPENRPVGSIILLPLASDLDSNIYNVKRYYLERELDDTFKLVQHETNNVFLEQNDMESVENLHPENPKQLYLQLQKPLDREKVKSYQFNLLAEDGGSPPLVGSTKISIKVLDVNDNHPKFSKNIYNLEISESTKIGEKLVQLQAFDPDDGDFGSVVYEIDITPPNNQQSWNLQRDENSPKASKFFRVDPITGWLSTIAQLNYESINNRFSFKVNAKDLGGDSGYDQTLVNIQVTDTNDEVPIIELEIMPFDKNDSGGGVIRDFRALPNGIYRWQIEEYISKEYKTIPLAILAISDPDTGQGGVVKCSLCIPERVIRFNEELECGGTNTELGVFSLQEISGKQYSLSLIKPLDFERSQVEIVKLFCHDLGNPRQIAFKIIEVSVLDINDHVPKLNKSLYQYSIRENEKLGIVLDRIQATDSDKGINGQITYFLSEEGSRYFHIGQFDGILSTSISFDREEREYYRFQVFAKDSGSQVEHTVSAAIEVSILDDNDHDPKFLSLSDEGFYAFQTPENAPIGTHVGSIQARDEDGPENSIVSFRLLSFSNEFSLNTETGDLTTAQELDRESRSSYTLNVLAIDNGIKSRTSTVKVVIEILDENDHDPFIIFPTNGTGTHSVSYKEPLGEIIAKIEVRDSDIGINALLRFLFMEKISLNPKSLEMFYLDEITGEIRTNKQMTQEDIGSYPVSVIVKDSGIISRSSSVHFKILVDDSKPRKTASSAQRSSSQITSQKKSDIFDFYDASFLGISSTGIVLVALVALICAIILVILGFTAYLCGRKNFLMIPNQPNRPQSFANARSITPTSLGQRYTFVEAAQTTDSAGSLYNFSTNKSSSEEKIEYNMINSSAVSNQQYYRVLELQPTVKKIFKQSQKDNENMRTQLDTKRSDDMSNLNCSLAQRSYQNINLNEVPFIFEPKNQTNGTIDFDGEFDRNQEFLNNTANFQSCLSVHDNPLIANRAKCPYMIDLASTDEQKRGLLWTNIQEAQIPNQYSQNAENKFNSS